MLREEEREREREREGERERDEEKGERRGGVGATRGEQGERREER